MPELSSDGLILGIWTLSVEPHCCITCSFKIWGVEVALIFGSNLPRRAYILCYERSSMPRGTQMPYLAAVDLVVELGASQVISEHLCSILGLKRWILDKLKESTI
ncbi:hypothetical protein M9H77_09021 [Catharanthus roseus]|uniref:Uncharacterized protein n=1 Tax=Catharanthus roseus TaxID=4058 RepID=A0ACC0BZV0_CATRO|nr:hypothetical protein M9H77_09021 [Catharanthus roseus]